MSEITAEECARRARDASKPVALGASVNVRTAKAAPTNSEAAERPPVLATQASNLPRLRGKERATGATG